VDDNQVLCTYYPFKNQYSCTVNYLEKNKKKWDVYRVTSLYFLEVYTTIYEKAEKLCQEIEERPVTDEEERARLLRSSALSFFKQHALGERNASQVSTSHIITLGYFIFC